MNKQLWLALLSKIKDKQVWLALLSKIKVGAHLFFTPTVCVQCLRGRLFFCFGMGALLSGNFLLGGAGLLVAFIFTALKHKWWKK